MKLTDKERNTCAALLCRWAARDNELMASEYYRQQPVLQAAWRADSPAHAGPYGGNRPFRRTRARRVLQP